MNNKDFLDLLFEHFKPSTISFALSLFSFSIYFLLQYLNKKYAKEFEENPSIFDPFYRSCERNLKILGTLCLIGSIVAWLKGF